METNESAPLLNNNVNHGVGFKKNVPQEAPAVQRYLVMVVAIILQAITVGIMFSLAVMYAELVVVFDSNRSQVAVIQSVYSGLTTGGGVLLSPVLKRYGPGPSIIFGTILSAIGISSAFAATNVITLIFCVSIIGSFGMSFCYLASFISVSWIFHNDPGAAIVVVSIGSSLGQFVGPYLMEIFIQEYRWNGAFLLLAGVALQSLPCGCFIYICKRFYKSDMTEDDLSITRSFRKICDRTLLTDVVVILILINSFLLAFTGNIEAWFFVDILSTRGYERERGSFLAAMLGLANFFGRIAGSFLKAKVKVKTIYHWIYIWPLIAASHILAINVFDYNSLLGVCMFYGITLGTVTSQGQAIMFEVCGLSRSPQGVAMVNLMYGLGNFCCSTLGGVIKDVTGEYDLMFYLSGGLAFYISIAATIIACILRRRDRLTEDGNEEKPFTKVQYKKLVYGTNDYD